MYCCIKWKSVDQLIDDINDNNIYVVTEGSKITRFNRIHEYAPCEERSYIDKVHFIFCEYHDEWIDCCDKINLCDRDVYYSRDNNCCESCVICSKSCFCNFWCLPCTIGSYIISILISPLVLCCKYSYACCCAVYYCNKNCDLRRSIIVKTSPFDFRSNMIYGESQPAYITPPELATLYTEFNTSFGKVVLGYNDKYRRGNSNYLYVNYLSVDGFDYRIEPVESRCVISFVGKDVGGIIRQYME